jgi:hypothetical protein
MGPSLKLAVFIFSFNTSSYLIGVALILIFPTLNLSLLSSLTILGLLIFPPSMLLYDVV